MSTLASTSRLVPRLPATAVAVVATVAAFLLGRVLWPDPPGSMTPPGSLLPAFLLLSAIESVAFGLGIAFLVFGPTLLRRLGGGSRLTWAAYGAIAFMLLSWWPHDNMHRVLSHHDFGGLARIEYLFHLPLMVAAAITATFFLRTLGGRDADA
ncbi:hypothetical protein HDA40_007460 [Hamadaea flava]|uniref:Uncharacterized protein n=1 Tax=Hamadaea flava TaxID=1742688 RepID=A0ABV8LY45_9ACTN|nr:hypothetical protein [Hamadaea flava]MCP2328953.1 hypothetical protein [Hamadaea flava]